MNSGEVYSDKGRNLNAFYAYKDTFDDDSVWLEIPQTGKDLQLDSLMEIIQLIHLVTFVNISDPYALPSDPELSETTKGPSSILSQQNNDGGTERSDPSTTGSAEIQNRSLEALSAAALYTPPVASMMLESAPNEDRGYEDVDAIPLGHGESLADGLSPRIHMNPTTCSRNVSLLPNLTSELSPPTDPSPHHIQSEKSIPHTFQGFSAASGSHLNASTETDRTTALLLRHFSEVTGRW